MKIDFQPPRIAMCRLAGPSVPAGKAVVDPVSTIDLAQSFCDYGQAVMDKKAYSRSLRPLVETETASRDFACPEWDLRHSSSGVELQLRAVLTLRHKLSMVLGIAPASCTMLPTKSTTSSTMPHWFDISAFCWT